MKYVAILLLCLLPAFGQPPRNFFAWWDSPVARDLNLTADQQNQIRTVVQEYRKKLVDVRAETEKAEIDVEQAFNDDVLDQRKAGESIERLVAARGEMTRSISQMSLRLRAILTPDQWRELQKRRGAMRDEIRQRMQGPGPDGLRPRQQMRRNPAGPPPQQPPQQQ
jgi:Spy/CpxP family protein refolding chaperone